MNKNIAWIFKYVKELKWLFVLGIILSVVSMILSFGITGIQKWLIDDVFVAGHYERLLPLLGIFIIIIILSMTTRLASLLLNKRNQFLFLDKISKEVMSCYYRMPVRKYHNERIGSIVNYLTNDVHKTSQTVSFFLPDAIVSIARVLVLVAVIGFASPTILLVTTGLCIAYIGLGKYFGKRFNKMAKDVQKARSDMIVQVEEGISSSREVIAFHRTDWEKEKYNKSFQRLFQACRYAEIYEMIEDLPEGFDTEVGERGINLSGGQRQRIALARAILNNPEVLILDEATSALDLETERRVQKNIDYIRKGKTTIIIAHRLSTVENADVIYVMNDGEILESGSHNDLMSHGKLYSDLVYAQLKLEQGA
jgi:ABC-type multidrug transport system fused ATPase/permease subunit